MRYKEIKKKIISKYESLPKNQKIIADYFIDNFDRIPFLSVQDISIATSRSVASIVRFAQRVGFKGFLEMREEIAQTLQGQIEKKQIFSLIDSSELKDDTLTHVANQDFENISQTIHLIDRSNFDKAVKIILKSENVFTAGLGVSFLLAEILAYQLNQVAVNAKTFTHNYASFLEQMLFLSKKDCIIALSLPPYSKETIESVKFAKSKGIKVISITNKEASPITFHSDVTLVVSSKNLLFTNSFAAISVIINAITTECALRNKIKAKAMLTALNDLVEKQDIVISE